MNLQEHYSFQRISKEVEDDARRIIYLVLEEFGLYEVDSVLNEDLKRISEFYKNDYFGVIKYQNLIVGTYAIIALKDDIAEIRKMYLLKEHRSKGLGTLIMSHLLDYAYESGFKKVTLETASILVGAIRLYQKLGFSEIDAKNNSPRCDRQFEMSLNERNNE